jgi:hypothetical protein
MLNSYAVLLALCCGPAEAATESTSGFASSDNFVVYAPTQELADEVLKKSETLRTKLARAWLDKELAPGVGAAMIHVSLANGESHGFTWPKSQPDEKYHSVTIKSSREKALNIILPHELTHALMATEFGGRLPRWANEGVACFQDGSEILGNRRQSLYRFAQTAQWPSLEIVLRQESCKSDDYSYFTVASSITEFLLERESPKTFFAFAMEGQEKGWEFAARTHYEFHSVHDLESKWHEWVRQSLQTGNQDRRGADQTRMSRLPRAK